MVNYQEGKIYKIVCNKTGLVFTGSTTELQGHNFNNSIE